MTDDEIADLQQLHDMLGLNDDGTPPDLHPDLVPYVDEGGRFGPVLHHSLVIEMFYDPLHNGRINRLYEAKLAAIDAAADAMDWDTFVFLRERPYRLDAFAYIAEEIEDDATYWRLLASLWIDTENLWQNVDLWREFLDADRPGRTEYLMDDDADRTMFEHVPDMLTVYRGVCIDDLDDDSGLSWTSDETRAEWFARRFASVRGDEPTVLVGTVNKGDVIATFAGRGEEEVVVLPEHVTITAVKRLDDRPTTMP